MKLSNVLIAVAAGCSLLVISSRPSNAAPAFAEASINVLGASGWTVNSIAFDNATTPTNGADRGTIVFGDGSISAYVGATRVSGSTVATYTSGLSVTLTRASAWNHATMYYSLYADGETLHTTSLAESNARATTGAGDTNVGSSLSGVIDSYSLTGANPYFIDVTLGSSVTSYTADSSHHPTFALYAKARHNP